MLTAKDIHKHEGYNICGKCYVDINNPRVRMILIIQLILLTPGEAKAKAMPGRLYNRT